MTRSTIFCIVAAVLIGFRPVPAEAHPISVTEAQVFVARNSARMRIRLFAEDLYLFHNLQPNEMDVLPEAELKRGLAAHGNFLLQKVTLRDAQGNLYQGRVTDVQPFEIPEGGISIDELMLHAATYELEFPFERPPEFLTLQQEISDESFIFPSEMKLTLHQAGTDITYAEVLKPGAPLTLRFDWSGDVLTDEASDEEWQAWFERQREATLGITSYSSVYSFLYIEPAEVRHEVLIPVATLRNFLPIEHTDPAFITVDEQDAVRQLIRDWLKDGNPVVIDGKPVSPEFSRIDFYGLDLKDFAQQAKQRKISLANGRVGIILTYPAPRYPIRDVQLRWDKFNSSLRKIQSVVINGEDMQRFEFSRFKTEEDNTFHWQAPDSLKLQHAEPIRAEIPPVPELPIPVLSLLLFVTAIVAWFWSSGSRGRNAVACLVIGAVTLPFAHAVVPNPFVRPPSLQASAAGRVLNTLLSGTYQALDFGREEQIYDELQACIDGRLLEEVYLQLREGLRVKEQGGAIARVKSVTLLDGEPVQVEDPELWPGFEYRCRWVVDGTVEHWGHIHERQNQFSARFRVEPIDGYWKITSMNIEDQQSLVTNTRLRKF